MVENKRAFTFVVLSYNHKAYIIEHLESIKYQIVNYGREIKVHLVIADDGSNDTTVALARRWIDKNEELFYCIRIIDANQNRGTCINYTDTWREIHTDEFKITAADDIYAFESIFDIVAELTGFDAILSMPVLLINEKIVVSKFEIYQAVASQIVFPNFQERIKKLSNINAPNFFFGRRVIDSKKIYDFIRSFEVTEDFPMHIKMGELLVPFMLKQIFKVGVYYRRTQYSTYIVKKDDFYRDKIKIFKYLMNTEMHLLNWFLLLNRLLCFKINNKLIRRLLNLNIYIYFYKSILNIRKIKKNISQVNIDLKRCQLHYNLIRDNSKLFINTLKDNTQ